tara:strand:- start:97 stop:714 length:618 start_codon:yes stop_codon:yes gene_type:complete
MKKEKIIDISNLKLTDDIDKSFKLQQEGQNLMIYIKNQKGIISKDEAMDLRIEAVEMLKQSDNLRKQITEKILDAYPEIKKWSGVIMSKDGKQIEKASDEVVENAMKHKPTMEVNSSEKTVTINSKSGVVNSGVIESIALGDDELRAKTIKKMVDEVLENKEEIQSQAPPELQNEAFPSKKTLTKFANDFLDDKLAEYYKNNAEA